MKLYDLMRDRLVTESAKYVNKELVKTDVRNYKCKVNGCNRNGYASGFCNAHYLRNRQGKKLFIPIRNRKNNDLCSVCGIKTNAKGGWGMCSRHYKLLRTKIIKDTIIEYLGGKCLMCGNSFDSVCYDLHHKDPKTKEAIIGNMFNNMSIKRICIETMKCELLCSNCHRIEHYGPIAQ